MHFASETRLFGFCISENKTRYHGPCWPRVFRAYINEEDPQHIKIMIEREKIMQAKSKSFRKRNLLFQHYLKCRDCYLSFFQSM